MSEGLPKFEELMLPVLRAIGEGRPTVAEAMPAIRQQFSLSDAQMETLLPSGNQSYMTNRAHWARNYMKHAGLVEPFKRGHYRITPHGQALLDSNPSRIDKTTLKAYPAFMAWLTKDSPQTTAVAGPQPQDETTETPQEAIEAAYEILHSTLAEELLEQLLAVSPLRTSHRRSADRYGLWQRSG